MKQSKLEERFARALRLHTAGRLDDARRAYREVLARTPGHAPSLHGLGVIAYQTQRFRLAADLFTRVVAAQPEVAAYWSNLGNALKALGRLSEGAAAYERAIALDPADVISLNNLGNLLAGRGDYDSAVGAYRRALAHRPDEPMLRNNLANALAAERRFDEAGAEYRRALALRPDYAEAHYNFASLLDEQGDADQAVGEYRRAIELAPDHLAARIGLGGALRKAGRLTEAAAGLDAVLAAHPKSAEAHCQMGRVMLLQGRVEDALARYDRALAMKPDYESAEVNRLLALNFSYEDASAIFDAHRRWGRKVEQGAPAPGPYANVRDPERRLRVAYLSPDFKAHSVAWYLTPLFAAHDRSRFEIIGYSDAPHPDAVTARFEALCDRWTPTAAMSDARLVDRIRADGVDILVDLVSHAGANRLALFARHPAPVQVSWLGYVNTCGLSRMDYRVVDEITDPGGAGDALASERLIRLPGGLACYEPPAEAPPPQGPPSLDRGHVTFGSFSNPPKLGDRVLDAWSEILARLPDSRLLVKGANFDDAGARSHLLDRLLKRGVAPERVSVSGWIPDIAGHLALYNEVDVALDPFPYNGYTTTCEALWMGLPVVALLGERHAARVSASFLSRVGLETFVARDLDDYVEIAVRAATDTGRLAELRRTLRARMAASPLCDAAGFARGLEDAYRSAWRAWCADEGPG